MKIITDIGSISLTQNQIMNWQPSGVWKSLHYIDGNVSMVSDSQPSQAEIASLIVDLQALQDNESLSSKIARFNPSAAIAREAEVFSVGELEIVESYSYVINEMMKYKNFGQLFPQAVGIKQLLQDKMLKGKATQEIYDKFNNILKEQGIDLDAI